MDDRIDLGDGLESYVEALIEEGRFASRDEVLRESVRQMQERERSARFSEFEESLRRGIEDARQGRGRPAEEVFDELTARYAAMAKARRRDFEAIFPVS